jgi:hypothetical protein
MGMCFVDVKLPHMRVDIFTTIGQNAVVGAPLVTMRPVARAHSAFQPRGPRGVLHATANGG